MLSKNLRRVRQYAKEHPIRFILILLGVTAAVAAMCVLPILGFSAAGPVAGSIAAGWQSSIGLVSAGSIFAFLQSAAMGGTAMLGIVGFGLAGAGVAGGAAFLNIEENQLEKIKDAGAAVTESVIRLGRGVGESAKKVWNSCWRR